MAFPVCLVASHFNIGENKNNKEIWWNKIFWPCSIVFILLLFFLDYACVVCVCMCIFINVGKTGGYIQILKYKNRIVGREKSDI